MIYILLSLSILICSMQAQGEPLKIAVASNFAKTIEEIGKLYRQEKKQDVAFAYGSTGKLYAQITHGAPFDAFLAADAHHPKLLEQKDLAVSGSRFAYAQGQIVIYTTNAPIQDNPHQALKADTIKHIAIANPETAPYGKAATEILRSWGIYEAVQKKLVFGENITHTQQHVMTGNAPVGFLALSQVIDPTSPLHGKGHYYAPSQSIYTPLFQEAIALKRSKHPAAVTEFLKFIRSDAAKKIMAKYGYRTPPRPN